MRYSTDGHSDIANNITQYSSCVVVCFKGLPIDYLASAMQKRNVVKLKELLPLCKRLK